MAPAGIEETLAVMGDLQRVFESREDADRIVKIQKKCEEAMQLIASRERHMADVLAEMKEQLREAESRATPPEPESAHEERVDAIKEEARLAWQNIDRLQLQLQQLEQYREGLDEQFKSLEAKRKQLESLAKEEMPRTLYEITLFAHISSIMWDFEEKQHVKGYITKAEEGDVRNFEFDPKKISQFELTNQLWDLID